MPSAVVLSEVMATDTPLTLELAVQTGVLPQVPLKSMVQLPRERRGNAEVLCVPVAHVSRLPRPRQPP
jgi:hypothetical protein